MYPRMKQHVEPTVVNDHWERVWHLRVLHFGTEDLWNIIMMDQFILERKRVATNKPLSNQAVSRTHAHTKVDCVRSGCSSRMTKRSWKRMHEIQPWLRIARNINNDLRTEGPGRLRETITSTCVALRNQRAQPTGSSITKNRFTVTAERVDGVEGTRHERRKLFV